MFKSEKFQRGYDWAKNELHSGRMTCGEIEFRISNSFDSDDFEEGANQFLLEHSVEE